MPFDAHQARRELRRAIPILKQHGLRQSAKFCAEQLIGLSGDGIPATNQPPPAPSVAAFHVARTPKVGGLCINQ